MGAFSDITLAALKKAGWWEGRRVDTVAYESALAAVGCPAFSCVKEFLSRFGGLKIEYPNFPPDLPPPYISFDILVIRLFPDDIRRASKHVGVPLCLIGESWDWEVMLLMDQEGRVYGAGRDDALHWCMGNDGDNAIELYCSRTLVEKFESEGEIYL